MTTAVFAPSAQLALDVLHGQASTSHIPTWLINPMEHVHIDRLAGEPEGSYVKEPERVYLAMQKAIGTCLLDQWIPTNPLSMGAHGFQHGAKSATQGIEQVVADGIVIDSPEAVVEHLQRFVFPQLIQAARDYDIAARTREVLAQERAIQQVLGPTILKSGYSYIRFPGFAYGLYGYANYFMAYALYPEVIERCFSLQADLCLKQNQAAAAAYRTGEMAPLLRLDHDMADSRGMLVDIRTLDRIWFPHFARCLAPVLKENVQLIWHCDGNLMDMVPRLLEVGIVGFQGFQYEDGMDYQKICQLKTRDGEDLLVIAGSSVTRTLPYGKPEDVRREMKFLVENGPPRLFLGCSSSIAPGVPWENMVELIAGFRHYYEHGR